MPAANRLSRNLRKILLITALSGLAGLMIGVVRAGENNFAIEAAYGALTGTIIGCGCTCFEFIGFSNSRLRAARRLPPVALLIGRTLAYSLVILFGLGISSVLVGDVLPWQEPEFSEVFLISATVAFFMSGAVEVTRLLGSEATLSLVSGRYNTPRLETRVVLFADLVGSTALAEKIGELEFHVFLQDVALDLAGPIEDTRGAVHRYVGDAVIVTWPLESGVKQADCLSCALEMHRTLATHASRYRKRFGTEPSLRVALHCGQVAAGEIGDWKKEIALLGDTMNTTARIERAANSLGSDTVLSDALVKHLPEQARTSLRRLPDYKAHGKQEPLRLWTTKI
ncbi:adenylate/guanylate cyclase domain-containing protein [Roseibium porphyridii]|uniref:Adenylate/guanylate cyclase domain-containing protein n=1 Tax=Roseibium porphyridii TaxID=2866279 RepID=A0ABY8F104_9HYPH|nr:adenylate/guanylate cyclase domain-containing protein [Roseibium sp. KMA01]WFE89128.1 adenylate/guanylate cyclase domain-containing protein [Roseibium sp. KMA01]